MTTPRRPSTWHLWLPLLLVALVVAGWALTRSHSVQEAPAGPVVTQPAASPTASPHSSGASTPASGLPTIEEARLPRQAKGTLALIRAGGPYPYRQDDGVFGNREGLLPRQRQGYYREYTVETPGSGDRGPRRIIAGAKGDLFWTTDHYDSFRQILEGR